jgi:protein TonB
MRLYTLAVSLVVHLFVLTILVAVPLVATDTLPDPRHFLAFVQVVAPDVPPPPQVLRPAHVLENTARADAAPVEAPDEVKPETERPPDVVDPGGSVIPGELLTDILGAEPAPPPPARHTQEPLPVGGQITRPQRVHDVPPVYPPLARMSRVEGTVILEAVIGVDGTVQDVRVLRSIPLLDASAIEAVHQWRFTPTLLNGEPVAVVMTVTVTFSLR